MKCNFLYHAHIKIPFYLSRLIISNRVHDIKSVSAAYIKERKQHCTVKIGWNKPALLRQGS